MLSAGLMFLVGAALVDHAHSARRQSKGSGPGLVPLFFLVRGPAVGAREESAASPPFPCHVSVGTSLRVCGAPCVLFGLPCAVVDCPLLLLCGCVRFAVAGVGVAVALALCCCGVGVVVGVLRLLQA